MSNSSSPFSAEVLSPNGRNSIRIKAAPLAYEIACDGNILVPWSKLSMTINGRNLGPEDRLINVTNETKSGTVQTPVYKKGSVDLSGNEAICDFGDWSLRIAARNDGVAYRFETKFSGKVKVNDECSELNIPDPDATCWTYFTPMPGMEECVNQTLKAADVRSLGKANLIYMPFIWSSNGKTVAVTDADVYDYPVFNYTRTNENGVHFRSTLGKWPKVTDPSNNRQIKIVEHENALVPETEGTRTYPWRCFIIKDAPSQLCESDIVFALARPAAKDSDFSWVKPGKVAWDWWNAWYNQGDSGCTTATYERYIDFAARNGVEYVILDEGWSEKLNIWKYNPAVDVLHLIDYAEKKGVGIILWMAWAQVYQKEEKVADYFAKTGAKGFKVDFMDRGDADVEKSLWLFAEECAKRHMLVDYHGAHRPTGMHRAFPNVINYEGIHGLEQMKWFNGKYDFMASDVKSFFCRLTAGPMDYTPGAMDNYPVGKYPVFSEEHPEIFQNPGSEGTRCRQMAMMALYEAPLQMLCDSPDKYEKNIECFNFMAATPVVWDNTVSIGGDPDTCAAVARKAKDGSWYAAAINNATARVFKLDTSFLGSGTWKAEIFHDADDSNETATKYVHKTQSINGGDVIDFTMAPGGGFIVKFVH